MRFIGLILVYLGHSKAGVKFANIVGPTWHNFDHTIWVDHTILSGMAKLLNLSCSTLCDNVQWTMLTGYVKLINICWTSNQVYIVINLP